VKRLNRSPRTVSSTRSRTPKATAFQAIIDGLVNEMARLIRSTEPWKFSPPFKLVIIGNRGRVAFSGQVNEDGKMQPSGPQRQLRRSDFPANALITDQSLAIRTFRIDCARA
jgi:hypothetical protein